MIEGQWVRHYWTELRNGNGEAMRAPSPEKEETATRFFFITEGRIPAQRPGRGAYMPRRGFLPAKCGGQRGLWLGALLRQRGGHGGGFLPDAAFWGAVAQAIPSFADRPGAPGFLPDLVDVVGGGRSANLTAVGLCSCVVGSIEQHALLKLAPGGSSYVLVRAGSGRLVVSLQGREL